MLSLGKFWDTVPPERRHIPSAMEPERLERQLERWDTNLFRVLPWEKIHTALDWGCGGGLLAQKMVNLGINVSMADISMASLKEAAMTVERWEAIYHLPDNPEIPTLYRSYDLLLCYQVIHHFPGYEYFQKIAKIWNYLNPTQIALQYRRGPRKEASDYQVGDNYIFGLILPDRDILRAFPGYHLDYYNVEGGWGHMVLHHV